MKPRSRPTLARRLVSGLVTLVVLAVVAMANRPMVAAAGEALHTFQINRQSYKERYGHWARLPVPRDFKVNAIHAALLHTGKMLIIAGSGNDRDAFEEQSFRTVLYDPRDDEFTEVPTPTDVFCAGHTFLPDGKLLVAGGTKSYEVLAKDVEHAAGVMKIKNESPDGGPRPLPKGTRLLSATGEVYRTRSKVTVPAAHKATHGATTTVHAGEAEVWVDAVAEGDRPVVKTPAQYSIDGLTGAAARNLYGVAEKITREKQEYGGDKTSYEFDPLTERYVRTGDMRDHRWYPTLIGLTGGDVIAVSGLDQFGRILPGRNERYLPAERRWVAAPELKRYFPTYPGLHLAADGRVFYSGSNSGYGSDTEGRAPGLWNVERNTFDVVPGLRDAHMNETSSSVLLPPAQDQKVMILGGGGVGESEHSTARTDIADLDERKPRYRPGPDLPKPARYLSTVVLPDDTVFTTGGSSGYRGGPYRGEPRSDLLNSQIYHPGRNAFETAADSTVGRNYHAEAILLPDGRVITMGGDPLYDRTGKNAGTFEKRIEIYSPPYLFRGERPVISGGPAALDRGATAVFESPDAARIASARLVRPSAVTHVTDVDQRSVALGLRRTGSAVEVTVPEKSGLVPSGWYMLFLVDDKGVPSVARWVRVR
ncbi:galactose oxidase early set domain-containing protein [Actinoplanes sp. NEAU-A12]|uniref:Galactose oxidase early set domain-containing protein n=1 Tax=Actinoplanes sandaracinus TaxID=3045177 RepID=A0ABT6WFB3_9ACTN|nr:galactose oxidase early set domain-containing protein [Actinoplanes sandaracinus]MDI6098413.1 galactose oxidase early set domain-containing protein [Actinoplanes sandaracinus]